ncbi:unnamed protein product [Meganyctiphanes norvegica]|uniref:NACHT domain-containing protein n=1 Tax=Meganyctiphanes norvegica TaxID=48144 RepID=A0AAV2RQK3_MEGNR
MSSVVASHTWEIFLNDRYKHAATVIGQKVSQKILNAYTEGKISNTFKDELLKYYVLMPEGTQTTGLYKKEFNRQEQKKLENPSSSPKDFDVSMIDKLLRRLKPLTELQIHYDKIWTEDEPPGSNSSIEYLIHQVKVNRNDAAHDVHNLTDKELAEKLINLEKLYITLLEKVLTEKGKTLEIISNEVKEIRNDFKNIEVFTKNLQTEVIESCQSHLRTLYRDTYDETNPCDWLGLEKVDIQEVFTDIIISEEEKDLSTNPKPGLNINATKKNVDYRDLLKQQTKSNKTPRVLTLTATGGNGKTTFTRLIVCKWAKKEGDITHLLDFSILFFIELRNLSESSFSELVENRLGDVLNDTGLSLQKLTHVILRQKILFILDGQDEAPQNDFLKDILGLTHTRNNIKLILTTRPSASIQLKTIIDGYSITKLDFHLVGISKENQFIFIQNLVMAMESDTDKQVEILDLVREQLPHLNDSMGEVMQSPLMLTLLAVLWVAGEILESVTTTEVFMKVNNLLRGKLEARIQLKMSTPIAPTLKADIDTFEEYLQEIAFVTFSRLETNFEDATIALLKDKIKQCHMESFDIDLLGHYLAPRKGRKNLIPVMQYSYKHLRMHEYDASKYVCRVLASGSEEDKEVILEQISDERFNNIRAHTIAIMAETDEQLLAQYGQDIVNCEKSKDNNVDGYLRLLTESKCNSAVVEMAATRMAQKEEWEVKNPSGVASVVSVLHRTQPDTLFLDFQDHTVLPLSLPSYLAWIITHKLELRLWLPWTPDSSSSSPTEATTHDDCLLAACHPDARATLTEFSGRLSGSGVTQLPPSL